MHPPLPFTFTNNGLELAGLDWGGSGADLLLLHPNGFCAGIYQPIAEQLVGQFRVVGLDLPGHGASAVPAEDRRLGYDHAADDVAACLDVLGIDRAQLCGVSLGGGVGLMAALRHPHRVARVLACEPIVFPPAAVPAERRDLVNPMATGALKRRRIWPDRSTVQQSYASRQPLEVLDPRALGGYVQHGFTELTDGTVALACPPEVEAAYFAMDTLGFGPFEAFDALVELSRPVTLLKGAATNLPAAYFDAQAAQLGVKLEVLDGTHFFLFEDIERAVAKIVQHLGTA